MVYCVRITSVTKDSPFRFGHGTRRAPCQRGRPSPQIRETKQPSRRAGGSSAATRIRAACESEFVLTAIVAVTEPHYLARLLMVRVALSPRMFYQDHIARELTAWPPDHLKTSWTFRGALRSHILTGWSDTRLLEREQACGPLCSLFQSACIAVTYTVYLDRSVQGPLLRHVAQRTLECLLTWIESSTGRMSVYTYGSKRARGSMEVMTKVRWRFSTVFPSLCATPLLFVGPVKP